MKKIKRTCPKTIDIDKIGRINNYDNKQQTIREELIKLNQLHCSFSDCLLHISEYTPHIEHFKPINQFPNLRTVWHNLFTSCPKCNIFKHQKYPEIKPLKPDTTAYSFSYWFEIEYKTNIIKPNECRCPEEKLRAETTIAWFGLNKAERPQARIKEYKRYKKEYGSIDEYSYRFFIQNY